MIHRSVLLLCVFMIFAMGLVMIFETSSADVLDRSLNQSTHQALYRQILYGIAGVVLGGLTYLIGYKNLFRLGVPILVFVSFLLLLVFVPGIGKTINGARRWIGVSSYTVQPSEIIKLAIPLYLIPALLKVKEQGFTLQELLKALAVIAVPIALVFLEPDTGTTAILGLVVLLTLILTEVPRKYWLVPVLLASLFAVTFAFTHPYVRGRISVYLNPELDRMGRGHQPYQAKIASGSGKLWGKGVGMSLQKLNYLPEAQNDYIAAIYAEEFGFMGIMLLILMYMSIAYCGFHIAFDCKDLEGFYLAAIVTSLLCLQAFLNLGVVSGLLPSTGLNLPFFSQGGSSLVVNICSLAILLSISYQGEKKNL